MNLLKNTRIAVKIGAIVVALALTSIGFVVYLTSMMKDNDAQMAEMNRRGRGLVMLARANRNITELGYEAYKAQSYPGTSTEAQQAAQQFKSAMERFKQNVGTAESLLPVARPRIVEIRQKLLEHEKQLSLAVEAGLRDDNAEFIKLMTPMDVALKKASAELADITNARVDAIEKQSAGISAEVNSASLYTLVLGILAGLVGIATALLVSAKGITGPLGLLQGRMHELAGGKLEVEVAGQDRRDEVGQMAKAVQVFKDNALRAKALEAEAAAARQASEAERARNEAERAAVAEAQAAVVADLANGLAQLAEGNLTGRLRSFPQDYKQLEEDFNAAIGKLQETITVIAGNSQGIHSGTGEISQAADNLSKRTEQQAASLEETAAALDEIVATVRKTADGANHARQVVSTAKSDAERSGQIVGNAVAAMSEIEKSSTQISQIIGVIDEIAFQTNLLALNAGVEAARAGEAGKGFAVVASEVRALAQRSAEAAKEIKALIQASTGHVSSGVELVGETGKALDRIVAQVTEINGIVTEIAASAQEQSTALAEVNTAVNQMDQMTQQNAAMVEESTAASHSLAQEAEKLTSLVGQFRTGQETSAAPARRSASAAKPRQTAPRAPARPMSRGNTALAHKAEPVEDSWEEF